MAFVLMLSIFSVPIVAQSASEDPASDPNFQLVSDECGQIRDGKLVECGWPHFLNLINRIMKYLIFISASIGVLMFAYAGFLYLTAFGEMGKVEQAHKIFSTTITGIVIIMIAWLIVATILNVLQVMPEFTVLEDNLKDTKLPQNIEGRGVDFTPERNPNVLPT